MKSPLKTILRFSVFFIVFSAFSHAAVRIMPLGDSITYDDTYADKKNPRPASKRSGYRNYLWYMLQDAGYPADFVGSQVAGTAISPPFDPDNEGHPGWTTYDIAEHAYDYMIHSQPDIVLLHIGTNDRSTTNPGGVAQILDEIDQYENNTGHHVKVFVALIIDRREQDGRITIFNDRLNDLLQQRIAGGDDIVIVDMFTLANLTSSDYADNTHPNNSGYLKIAQVWFNAIINNQGNINIALHAYPSSLVPEEYIESINYNDDANTVEFVTQIPDDGITF